MNPYARLLVPVDFGPQSIAAARQALDLAARLAAEVRFLSVVDLRPYEYAGTSVGTVPMPVLPGPEMSKVALERLHAFVTELGPTGVVTSTQVRSGIPFEEILIAAKEWKPGMIIMGTHGRKGIARVVLGSQAEMVVRRSDVPVLVVRGEP